MILVGEIVILTSETGIELRQLYSVKLGGWSDLTRETGGVGTILIGEIVKWNDFDSPNEIKMARSY